MIDTNNYKQSLSNTLKVLSEKYIDQWRSTTSKACFMLRLNKYALSVCHYLDSQNANSLSIYQIDTNGNAGNDVVISEREEKELYDICLAYYTKIKEQVKANKLRSISSLLA